ncbi:MAG: hypothetical protein ACJAWS_002243 [Oleiphilaceae bacterium]|jgi:hypothetical protein
MKEAPESSFNKSGAFVYLRDGMYRALSEV